MVDGITKMFPPKRFCPCINDNPPPREDTPLDGDREPRDAAADRTLSPVCVCVVVFVWESTLCSTSPPWCSVCAPPALSLCIPIYLTVVDPAHWGRGLGLAGRNMNTLQTSSVQKIQHQTRDKDLSGINIPSGCVVPIMWMFLTSGVLIARGHCVLSTH